MIRVITVIGHGIELLPHFIEHYSFADEIDLIVYSNELYPYIEDDINIIIKDNPRIKIIHSENWRVFDWKHVTKLYNDAKNKYPDDWWIVADIDEFQVYPIHIQDIINDCNLNGWDLVRGGFIDRIGENGDFPKIRNNTSIFNQYPLMGFFRTPMSNACPNKICIMKGNIELTAGQHYANIDGHTTWRWQGWNHPLIAPYDKYNVQVHHFKWDSTCIDRIKAVADLNKEYAFSKEYQLLYDKLKENDFRVDIYNKEYMFQYSDYDIRGYYEDCCNWKKIINKIIAI